MKKATLALGIVALAFASCQNNERTNTTTFSTSREDTTIVMDMHNSQIALDWTGTYEGTLPCADCTGIKTTIVLKDNNTFTRHLEYLDKEAGNFDETGDIEWQKNGNNIMLRLADGEKQQYKVREGSLLMLNQDGTEVAGPMAKHYVLTKKD